MLVRLRRDVHTRQWGYPASGGGGRWSQLTGPTFICEAIDPERAEMVLLDAGEATILFGRIRVRKPAICPGQRSSTSRAGRPAVARENVARSQLPVPRTFAPTRLRLVFISSRPPSARTYRTRRAVPLEADSPAAPPDPLGKVLRLLGALCKRGQASAPQRGKAPRCTLRGAAGSWDRCCTRG